jgi:hypothetical protein
MFRRVNAVSESQAISSRVACVAGGFVSSGKSIARVALLTAGIGSGVVGLLLAAASLGIWMQGANLNSTPRVNASTVGLALAPIPALAWILYLWFRTRPRGVLDVAFRILVSCVLVLGAAYCLFAAMIEALFVG